MVRATRAEFERALLGFVVELTTTRRRVGTRTPLFAGGLLDSLRVLDLIAFVESALGIQIPDRRVTLENFKNVSAISDAFWNGPKRRG
jgi:acyl carrier protein